MQEWLARSFRASHITHPLASQIGRRDGLALMTELPADGESRLPIGLALFRGKGLEFRSPAAGAFPAGQFLVTFLGIGMA